MSTARILYRTRQFWHALGATPNAQDLDQVRSILPPSLYALFLKQNPGEQSHSIRVYRRLEAAGETHPDLGTAALLHDVGKTCYSLCLWERVWIVLGSHFLPGQARAWGNKDMPAEKLRSLPPLQRPFVVAARHPAWGAELAARAGASLLAACLIRRHQELLQEVPKDTPLEDRLLYQLQIVDDES